jgi:hypothetical protein
LSLAVTLRVAVATNDLAGLVFVALAVGLVALLADGYRFAATDSPRSSGVPSGWRSRWRSSSRGVATAVDGRHRTHRWMADVRRHTKAPFLVSVADAFLGIGRVLAEAGQ